VDGGGIGVSKKFPLVYNLVFSQRHARAGEFPPFGSFFFEGKRPTTMFGYAILIFQKNVSKNKENQKHLEEV
jgi:hypothetical protein